MSKYTIVSERVGEPGATFEPVEGVNIDALIEGGFIKQTAGKSAKTEPEPTEEN